MKALARAAWARIDAALVRTFRWLAEPVYRITDPMVDRARQRRAAELDELATMLAPYPTLADSAALLRETAEAVRASRPGRPT